MSSKRFPFPMYPPELFPLFTGLCVAMPEKELPLLRDKVIETARDMYEHNAKEHSPDLKISYGLAEASHALLDLYPKLTEHQRTLAIGAVRFFIMRRDSVDDTKPTVGLDDDIAVMNYVLEEMGISNKFVSKN